jgi:uncharacterized protein
MRRLFLDANVLFTAAHNPDGKASLIIRLGAEGHWEIVTSDYAIEEARRNLSRKYPDRLAAFIEQQSALHVVPTAGIGANPLALPEKDAPIFETARRSGATHLLTGDLQHFGHWMNGPNRADGIVIQTVSAFLAAL